VENIITIKNGEKPTPTFSPAEMTARQQKLRALLGQNDIDAALFTSYHNINYYSDFLYCSFGRLYGMVVSSERAVTITANIDGGQPWRRTFGDNVIYTDWQRDNYFRALQQELGNPKTLGVEYDHLNVENLAKLKAAFPDTRIVDISKSVMALRMVKSVEEIAIITNGARIADIGGAACREAIGAGVPEYEVALHSTAAMVREIAATYPHTELLDTWTWFQSGINTDGAHNAVTSKKIASGVIPAKRPGKSCSFRHCWSRSRYAERFRPAATRSRLRQNCNG